MSDSTVDFKKRAGRSGPFVCSNIIFPAMRLLSKILWFFAFLITTFVWMVLFEHGFSLEGFSKGVREEWHALTSMVTGSPESKK